MHEKILGERIVEIVGDEWHRLLDPPRSQIGFARGQVQAAMLLVRHQVQDRASVARNDDDFALLDFAGELSQVIFGITDRYGLHGVKVAICGYFVKGASTLDGLSCALRKAHRRRHSPLAIATQLRYNPSMTRLLEQALEAMSDLPDDVQDDLARILLQLAAVEQKPYELTPDEEADINASLDEAKRGEFATDEEVRAMWTKHGL